MRATAFRGSLHNEGIGTENHSNLLSDRFSADSHNGIRCEEHLGCRKNHPASPRDNRLDDFQAGFSLLLGGGSADPDHAAALGAGRLFIEDKFDHLAAPKVETSAQSETFFRGIEDEAGEPLRLPVQIDNYAGRLFDITRFERRPLGTGRLGILSPTGLEVVMVRPDWDFDFGNAAEGEQKLYEVYAWLFLKSVSQCDQQRLLPLGHLLSDVQNQLAVFIA